MNCAECGMSDTAHHFAGYDTCGRFQAAKVADPATEGLSDEEIIQRSADEKPSAFVRYVVPRMLGEIKQLRAILSVEVCSACGSGHDSHDETRPEKPGHQYVTRVEPPDCHEVTEWSPCMEDEARWMPLRQYLAENPGHVRGDAVADAHTYGQEVARLKGMIDYAHDILDAADRYDAPGELADALRAALTAELATPAVTPDPSALCECKHRALSDK